MSEEHAAEDAGGRTGAGSKGKETADEPDGLGLAGDGAKRQRLSGADSDCSSPPRRVSSPPPPRDASQHDTPPDTADSRGGAPAGGDVQAGSAAPADAASAPDVAPELVDRLVCKMREMGGSVSEAEAALAIKTFDAKLDLACCWVLADTREEKERLEREHEQRRRREHDDLQMALSLQEDEHKQQQNHRLQKDKERERETAKRTGQVGCLFERTTRNRTAAKPVKEHDGGAARKPREHHGGVDRGRGEGAAARPVRQGEPSALDLLSRGTLARVEKHNFLQRPVIFQGKVGTVCEAHRDETGKSGTAACRAATLHRRRSLLSTLISPPLSVAAVRNARERSAQTTAPVGVFSSAAPVRALIYRPSAVLNPNP